MRVIVTGAAGFIGFHVCKRLLERGDEVVGIDNLSEYYDVRLKQDRIAQLDGRPGFKFIRHDLADRVRTPQIFNEFAPQRVVHLAAQAGVRYSLTHPHAYADANLVGFLNVLEACRHNQVQHLVFASSSSVYGANTRMPFSVHHSTEHPLSLYGATKKANEVMAHAYSHLYGLPATGLRFFTVYGPWGRPDMSLFRFTRNILEDKPIEVYNFGRHQRDFTYIDDIAEGVLRVLDIVPVAKPAWSGDHPDPATSSAPYRLYNIGNHNPVELLKCIEILEGCLGKTARKIMLPIQPGDVPATFADVDDLARDTGRVPATPIEEGIARFVAWYRDYYKA